MADDNLGRSGKFRGWAWTYNNYSAEEETNFIAKLKSKDYDYTIYSREIGKEGTPHLQGFSYFKNQRTLGGLKRLDKKVHWENIQGTPQQNIDYCSKTGEGHIAGPFEFGPKPAGQGFRSDLMDIKKKLDDGENMRIISSEHFPTWTRNSRAFKEYKLLHYKIDITKPKPDVTVIIGPTGLGKTKLAYESAEIEINDDDTYIKCGHNKWWDGYDGQGTIIIDEMKHSKDVMPVEQLLNILDRYVKPIETKGGSTYLEPKKIIITSNYPPCEWYPFAGKETVEALYRRIDKMIIMKSSESQILLSPIAVPAMANVMNL